MDQHKYIEAIGEMMIPVSKIETWARRITEQYYDKFGDEHRKFIDEISQNARKLQELIPQTQSLNDETDQLHGLTHILGGPIGGIRANTKIMLMELEAESEFRRYIAKINSAAEYLYSLSRDSVLEMMLERSQDNNTIEC